MSNILKTHHLFCTLVCFFFELISANAKEPSQKPYGMTKRPDSPAYLNMPKDPMVYSFQVVFPNISFKYPVCAVPEPGSQRIFICGQNGFIWAIDESQPNLKEKTTILDISSQTQGGWDSGLLNLSFHPEYGRINSPNRTFLYVWYTYNPQPMKEGQPPAFQDNWQRLSRFSVNQKTGLIDPQSEIVLIHVADRHILHAGGGMYFHPKNGFLYIANGDEGCCENTQTIRKSLYSGVLRIDVDQRGGQISHPIPRQPQNGKTAHYYIPNNNPFVGMPNVLEEFFAIGLRNPHRMTYDEATDRAWIGEVGGIEEINVIESGISGQNFGWEDQSGPGQEAPALYLQTHTPIGGYVYRGSRFPELYGKYIFGQFTNGEIYALSYSGVPAVVNQVDLLTTTPFGYNYTGGMGGMTSFGQTHQKELYLLFHGSDTQLHTLVKTGTDDPQQIPPLLSQTGVFKDIRNLIPEAGFIPFQPNARTATEQTVTSGWISLPTKTLIHWRQNTPWTFPAGTVIVQHFALRMSSFPSTLMRHVETRMLVAGSHDDSWYGVSYRWREDSTDADLIAFGTQETMVLYDEVLKKYREHTWTFPSRAACLDCHTKAAGRVLGINTPQLNGNFTYPGTHVTDNQLRTWNHLGMFQVRLNENRILNYPQAVQKEYRRAKKIPE